MTVAPSPAACSRRRPRRACGHAGSASASRRSSLALATAVSVAWHASNGLPVCDRLDPGTALGWSPLFVVDGLNAMLLPFAALIFSSCCWCNPTRSRSRRRSGGRCSPRRRRWRSFSTSNLVLLSVLWCVSGRARVVRAATSGGRRSPVPLVCSRVTWRRAASRSASAPDCFCPTCRGLAWPVACWSRLR